MARAAYNKAHAVQLARVLPSTDSPEDWLARAFNAAGAAIKEKYGDGWTWDHFVEEFVHQCQVMAVRMKIEEGL